MFALSLDNSPEDIGKGQNSHARGMTELGPAALKLLERVMSVRNPLQLINGMVEMFH
jgi:hypothetical protein